MIRCWKGLEAPFPRPVKFELKGRTNGCWWQEEWRATDWRHAHLGNQLTIGADQPTQNQQPSQKLFLQKVFEFKMDPDQIFLQALQASIAAAVVVWGGWLFFAISNLRIAWACAWIERKHWQVSFCPTVFDKFWNTIIWRIFQITIFPMKIWTPIHKRKFIYNSEDHDDNIFIFKHYHHRSTKNFEGYAP